MVDITVTVTAVIAGSNAKKESGIAGETIAQGKVCYRRASDNKYMLADNNSATAEARMARGISLNSAALNQPLTITTGGDLTLNGLTAGTAYYLSDTPGGICPLADLLTGEFVCLLGLAKSTTVLAVDIQYPGVSL